MANIKKVCDECGVFPTKHTVGKAKKDPREATPPGQQKHFCELHAPGGTRRPTQTWDAQNKVWVRG